MSEESESEICLRQSVVELKQTMNTEQEGVTHCPNWKNGRNGAMGCKRRMEYSSQLSQITPGPKLRSGPTDKALDKITLDVARCEPQPGVTYNT